MEENQEKETLWERLQYNYRLTIMNSETFEEVTTFNLSLLNVYALMSVIVVIVAFMVILLMAFTPAKRLIPGFDIVQNDRAIIDLKDQIDTLKSKLEDDSIHIAAFQRRLNNEVQTEEDVQKSPETQSGNINEIVPNENDEILRREVEMEELGAAARDGKPAAVFGTQDVALEQMYFTAPISGEISDGFMPNKNHYGVDIVSPKNTPVKAVMDGWVISSDWTLETGNTLGIQHTNNVITWYKHNSVLLKKTGAYVKAGEAVAIIGNTGDLTDGPHLHFELWHKGKPVDPQDYIKF